MEQLRNAFAHMEIPLTQKMEEQFASYMKGVLQWNEKINLTAITDEADFIQKHFVDSVLCVPFDEYRRAKKIIDVGTAPDSRACRWPLSVLKRNFFWRIP